MTTGPLQGEDPLSDAYANRPSAAPRSALALALERSRNRLVVTAAMITLAFTAVAGKLVDATLMHRSAEPHESATAEVAPQPTGRADIVDRNGIQLATSLATASLYADPKVVIGAHEAALKLATTLPDLDYREVLEKLSSDKRFVWIKRNLTPRQQALVHRLGLPGLFFEREERRFYPSGSLTSHVVGYTGIDNTGLGGIERHFDKRLRADPAPLRLSLDLRVQHILRKEMSAAVEEFKALGATGLVYDVNNGEVVAMVSLPDFNPQDPTGLNPETLFNRATLGVYEMGSTFKIFNTAMSLDSGKVRATDNFDASHPLQYGQFTIHDFENFGRALSVAEIFEHSSNIGSARMALLIGVNAQKTFMTKLGFMRPTPLELPEDGWPLVPNPWREINLITIAFGHGMSVSPMHTVAAAAAVINGGIMRPPTLLKREPGVEIPSERIVSPQTSETMRRLFRLVVSDGTAKTAAVRGYVVGGKTGTADKQKGKHYAKNARMSSFLGAFPMNDPRYIVYILMDEPQATAKTYGFATGGWVAAPAVGRIIRQIGPLLGVPPVNEDAPEILNAVFINQNGTTTRGSAIAAVPPPSR